MSSPLDSLARRRLRLALGTFARRSLEAIAPAVHLARQLDAEIAALYVEDSELLRAAALPFTREVGVLGAGARPLRSADVEAWLRTEAAEMVAEIEAAANREGVAWSFEVCAGQLLHEALARAGQREFAILVGEGVAHGPRLPAASTGAAPSVEAILAVVESPGTGIDTIAAVAHFVPASATVIVLTHGAGPAAELESALASLARGVRSIRREHSSEPLSAESLDAALRRVRPRLLVLTRGTASRLQTTLAEALRRAGGILMITP